MNELENDGKEGSEDLAALFHSRCKSVNVNARPIS